MNNKFKFQQQKCKAIEILSVVSSTQIENIEKVLSKWAITMKPKEAEACVYHLQKCFKPQ